ncbi:MAG: dTDP-4-dehydrorhamnose reductase [Methanobacteriota archaeon]|nr:MAG: dTDP-4-dehydrorhamnose reductase [Euryarchaeota archaeon]
MIPKVSTLLVIGASGLLGQHIAERGKQRFERVIGTYHANPFQIQGAGVQGLDIRSAKTVSELLEREEPDSVILCSALTGVDYCEEHPEEAVALNEKGPLNVAKACNAQGTKLLHISTDYVFDGKRGDYKETDEPNPINIYGKTKLGGEKKVLESTPNSIIARICVVYGWNRNTPKKNFVTWVLENLEGGEPVELFDDQIVTPTYADEVADILLRLVQKDVSGVFHASGSQKVSRYEFGKHIAEAFSINLEKLAPVSMQEVGLPAKRPKDSSLIVRKTEEELNIKMRPLPLSLKHMRENR